MCAERVAIFDAVKDGERSFSAIAIVGGRADDDVAKGELSGECPPCGVCRQVMAEFCRPDFKIILGTPDKFSVYTLGELLPHGFGAANM